MSRVSGLLARFVRSWCSDCGRPFYSDRRRPCRCGATARTFSRTVHESTTTADKAG